MATFTKNGSRKLKLDNNKNALKQLNNFSNIMQNMATLDKAIEDYPGIITNNKLLEIATLINLEQKLKLTVDQIKIVTKKYES